MASSKLEGLVAAPVTPFRPDGSVNLDLIPLQAGALAANGVVGAFVNGTTGEGFSLTVEERKAVAERWVKAAPAGLRVIVHVAHTSGPTARELACHAASIGAWAVAEMGPIFFKPANIESLVESVSKTAAAAPGLPYFYYHMPSMSGISFPMIDFLRAAESEVPNLAGIKYTFEDLADYSLCRRFRDGKYDILFGRDEMLLAAFVLGGRGAVGSTYNVMAPLYVQLIEAFDAGDLDRARELQYLSVQVIRCLAGTGCFISALKEVMKMIGLGVGSVRPPLVPVSQECAAKLKSDLTKLGFFDVCSKLPPA